MPELKRTRKPNLCVGTTHHNQIHPLRLQRNCLYPKGHVNKPGARHLAMARWGRVLRFLSLQPSQGVSHTPHWGTPSWGLLKKGHGNYLNLIKRRSGKEKANNCFVFALHSLPPDCQCHQGSSPRTCSGCNRDRIVELE